MMGLRRLVTKADVSCISVTDSGRAPSNVVTTLRDNRELPRPANMHPATKIGEITHA
ncbi:hypothetical protein [Rhodococcus globerulus]|uniref:hypothetical protein n=1 Tax=Rhodococcus globerulus TaxID=33008 RepID=UPI00301AF91B